MLPPVAPLLLSAPLAGPFGAAIAPITESGAGLWAWLVPVAIVALAALLARLLRRLLGGGALLLAGLIVGLAAGPGFFGRIAPDRYLALVEGPPAAFAPLAALHAEARSLRAVAEHTGGDAEVEQTRLDDAMRQADAHWHASSRPHRLPQEWLTYAIAVVALAVGGAFGARVRPGDVAKPEPLLLGLWISLPTALCGVAWAAALGHAPTSSDSLLLGASLAIGAWSVSGPERLIARGIRRDSARVALAASTVAGCVAALFIATSVIVGESGTAGIIAAAGLLALPAGHLWRVPLRWARPLAAVALPGMVALAALRIEPFRDVAPWTILVVYLLAEDGRWLAIATGERLAAGRRWLQAMLFALVPLRLGPSMAAVGSIGLVSGLLHPGTGFAILLTAVIFEFLGGARLRVARQLEAFASESESEPNAG